MKRAAECCHRRAAFTCTSCGREVCVWHSAGSPVEVDGVVKTVPVCLPACDASWWKLGIIERMASEAR